jgi:type VI secretion system protein ImpL
MSPESLQTAGQIWPWLLAAVLLVGAFIVLVMSSVVKRSGGGQAPKPAEPGPQPDTDARMPAGPLDRSFSEAGHFLKVNSAGRDYRYQVPWFMVAGRVGSGKSAMLASLGTGILYDEAPAALKNAVGLEWRFLDRGILLDVPGACLERENGLPGDERSWMRFLRLLEKNRPRRPIDGAVLAIPANDLIGPSALSAARLGDQAARYAARFAQAQRMLGFSFPVYVVVTKCDLVEGFGQFFREMPSRCHDDIFGWSNPYQLDASFTPDWADEAFDSVMQDLQRLQSEIFVERGELDHAAEVFLFPDEFGRLHDPLRTFLGNLFRETAYRESFRFRGLYFCGDISEEPVFAPENPSAQSEPAEETAETFQAALLPLHVRTTRPQLRRERLPILTKRLFEQKIFPERGIARPLSRVFVARNRMVLGIQIASLVLALILGLGLWFSYQRLARDRETLQVMLRQMLNLSHTAARADGQNDPGAGGVQLLFAMAPAGSIRFSSAFLPASWFSNTDDEITHVMTYGSEQWVLGTLERSLQKRASTILAQFTPKPESDAAAPNDQIVEDENADTPDSVPLPVNIESTAEYQQLLLFVNGLRDLKSNADIYEKLRHGGIRNVDQVPSLVRYLYGSDLSELQPNGHLAKALGAAQGPAFQLNASQVESAGQIMHSMIDDLFSHWFDDSLLLVDVQRMYERIGLLERSRTVGYTELNHALQAINQAGSDFASAGFRWAGKPTFELTGPLARVIQEPIMVQKNPFLSQEVQDYALRTGQEHLLQLQDRLTKPRTLMTGQLADIKDRVVLSKGTQDLERGLENALNLPFMVRVNTHAAPAIPALGTHVIWHVEPLQEAMRQIDIYNRFVTEGLKDEMAGLVSPLRRVALERLSQSVQDLINQAVTTETGNTGMTDEVNAIQDASEPLIQMANTLNRLGQIDTRNRMLQLVSAQSLNFLTSLDDQLTAARPYSAKVENWTGGGSAALAAFAASAPTDLTEYLNHQREQIKFLQQQAKPFVALLQKFLPNPPQQEARRIRKWQGIIQDFEDIDQKSPTANITLLEQFIRVDMNKITPATSCRTDAGAPESGGYLDFFVQQQARLYNSIVKRCESLASAIVLKTYTDLADQFNNTLGGKFPFGPLSADRNQTEVTAEDIQAFYKLLDQNGKTARSILTGSNTSFGESGRQAVQFLDQMEGLRALIIPAGAEVEKEPPLTLDVTPQLRVNRANETDGNQIIEWTLQIGGQIFRQNEPAHTGRWRPGSPIRLALRWAKDSTYLPQGDSRQPNLRALDRLIYFEYTNRWSLLTALKRQEAAPTDFAGVTDLTPYLLRFRIPTVPDARWIAPGAAAPPGASTVFVQFALTLAGTKTRATVSAFPTRAPQLQTSEIKE